jgi:hypothetical protein
MGHLGALVLFCDTEPPVISHSDLRRLNLDSVACLIEALAMLDPKVDRETIRTVFELLCRVDGVYRQGEGIISQGMKRRLEQGLVGGQTKAVNTILRFFGARELPSEVDVEVVMQDQLTGKDWMGPQPKTRGMCNRTFRLQV